MRSPRRATSNGTCARSRREKNPCRRTSCFCSSPPQIFVIVFAAVGLIALVLHVAFMLRPMQRFGKTFSEVAPPVLAIAGTVFGLSVTFLANSVWTTEDRARETVNAEARSISIMENYIESLTGPTRDGLYKLIEDYGREVAGEWDTMADSASAKAELALRDIYAAVIKGFAEGEQNRVVQQRLLAALDALSAARQQRLSMAQNVVSIGQWVLVIGLGLLLLLVAAGLHARGPGPRALALSAITLAITMTVFVIVQHDRPFVGGHGGFAGAHPVGQRSGALTWCAWCMTEGAIASRATAARRASASC